jgi:hypothetical protein
MIENYIPAAVFVLCFVCYLCGTYIGKLGERQRQEHRREISRQLREQR